MADYGELSLLLRNRNQNGDGAARLGASLGSAGNRQAYFNQGAMNGAKMADVLAQARQRQQAEIGRQALASKYEQTDPDLASMFRMSTNAKESSDLMGANDERALKHKLIDMASGPHPDLGAINALLLANGKGPEALSRVEGGVALNPLVTPDAQTMNPTAVGQADIGEKNAQTQSALAAAFEHGAQGKRALAGIDNDRASNSQIEDTADGLQLVNKKTKEITPLMSGGKPLTRPVKEPEGAGKLPEYMIAPMLAAPDPSTGKPTVDGTGKPVMDPTNIARFINKKQELGPKASDGDVVNALRQDDTAGQLTGPSADLATPQPNALSRLFGGGAQPSETPGTPEFAQMNGAAQAPAAPAAPVRIGDSPHPEGTKLLGPDGKLYVVKNGQPVLSQ